MIKKLLNPFAYFDDKLLLIIGLSTHLFFTFIALKTNFYFPDFIDLKQNGIDYTFWELLYQNTRNNLLVILCLFGLGKIFNSKTRLIDLINTILLAKAVFQLSLLLDFIPSIHRTLEQVHTAYLQQQIEILQQPSILIMLLLFAFVAILCLFAMFYYIFIGFKTATNIKTVPQILLFIVVLLTSIVISTVLAFFIPHQF